MTISRKFYNILKWLLLLVAVFFVFGLICFGVYMSFEKKYSQKYFPGTKVAGIEAGGLTRQGLEEKLNQKIDIINEEGVIFAYHNEKATLDAVLTSTEADIARPVIMFETERASQRAFEYARSDSWLYNLKERIFLSKFTKDFEIQVVLSEKDIDIFLNENFSHFSTPAQDASLMATGSISRQTVEFGIEEEVYGQALDLDKAVKELKEKLGLLSNEPIFLEAAVEYPEIYKKDCFNIESRAKDIVELTPIVLSLDCEEWHLEKEELLY
mgnify:CR=1 FL=1